MQTTTPQAMVPVEDDLLDLVLNDPDLLRAEFEAIIGASWPDDPDLPEPPRSAPPAMAPNPSGTGGYRTHPLPRSNSGEPGPGCPRPAAAGRQRSPPASDSPLRPPRLGSAAPGDRLAGTTSARNDSERQVMASTRRNPPFTSSEPVLIPR